MNYYYQGVRSGKIPHRTSKCDGEKLDSKAEAERYRELRLMQRAGRISKLKCHPQWEIIPAQRGPDGKVLFRAAKYTADFSYIQDGELIVEDVKSEYTAKEKDYIIRRKLMLHVNGIYVHEIIR